MRVRMVVLGVLAALAVLVLPAWGATANVSLQDRLFKPASITIHTGDKVIWKHLDAPPTLHTVTYVSGPGPSFSSGTLQSGDTYSHIFTKAGTYKYQCNFHASSGMVGQVLVVAATPTPAATKPGATPGPSATAGTGSGGGGEVTRTPPPGALAPVPLSATPLPLPSLTAPPLESPDASVQPFGTPRAIAAKSPSGATKSDLSVGLAIAAVLSSLGAAVATWLRYGRPA